MTTTHGGPGRGQGRKPNAIPSQRLVVHATDDEMTQILALTPRERALAMLGDDPPPAPTLTVSRASEQGAKGGRPRKQAAA